MKYTINDLTADEIVLIGEALDLLPHGRVHQIVAKIQPQIIEQETAERDRVITEREAAADAWRSAERQKLKSQLATEQRKSRKKER